MNRDDNLIFEAFINKNGHAGFSKKPASEEEINVQKADLNKDKKLSDYELARAKAIDKAQGGNGEVPSEDAEGKSSKLHPNTIKAQQLLDQAVQLIIKATNLPNVQWRYYDENNPDVDLQNALENIKDYVKQYIGF